MRNTQRLKDYLVSLGFNGNFNRSLKAFLKDNGFTGQLSQAYHRWLTNQGYTGDFNWQQRQFIEALASGPITVAQTAEFGDVTIEGGGGWRPQLASGAVESLTSYDGLSSGTLGSYTPSISSGRLVFTGGGAGAPDGAVLNCTGASGRQYVVTISEVADRRDVATATDIAGTRAAFANNVGLTVVFRQDAQISARDATLSTAFMDATNSTDSFSDATILNPTTVVGEGNHIDGEYHIHSWSNIVCSKVTFDGLKFADQKTDDSLIFTNTTSRPARDITVKNCHFRVDYDVDGGGADWSTGFPSTGYAAASFIKATTSAINNLTVKDNTFIGGYIHLYTSTAGYLRVLGNTFAEPYFDYVKFTHGGFPSGRNYARYVGGNIFYKHKAFSVNEGPLTEPHLDADQSTGGGNGPVFTAYEANIYWFPNFVSIQTGFSSDRGNTYPNGFRQNRKGEMFFATTPHLITTDYPDKMNLQYCIAIPSQDSTLPLATSNNRPYFGTARAGDGGYVDTTYVDRCAFNGSVNLASPCTAHIVVQTNAVNFNTYNSTDFGNVLVNWGDWGSQPEDVTYAEAFAFFEPVTSSALDGVSPWSYITPNSTTPSEYTISDTMRSAPTLSNLTITVPADSSFTVDTDYSESSALHWAVFTSEVTDAEHIREATNGTIVAEQFAVCHVGNDDTTITCTGRGTLASGTYWMCVAQFNGDKKSGVATLEFTVP